MASFSRKNTPIVFRHCLHPSPHPGTPTARRFALTRPWLALFRTIYHTITPGLLVVALFLIFMAWYAPHLDPQEFDYDEGLNLMKALLVDRGYALYTDVWSDQPPLMTEMLAAWSRLFGTSLITARSLVILLSALLLWALYRALRLHVSRPAAWAAVILLVISDEYIRLSSSVMIGLPALALAVLSLYLLLASRHRPPLRLLSAVVMAAALQTKLMVAMVLPAVALYLLLENGRHRWDPFAVRLLRTVAWPFCAAVAFLLIGLSLNAIRPDMLLLPHLGSATRNAFADSENVAWLLHAARVHALYLLLAGFGVVGTLWQRRGESLIIPGVWLLTAVVALLYHKPLWHHHITLLTIPLAWLSAFGVETLWCGFRHAQKKHTAGKMIRYGALAVASAAIIAVVLLYPKPLPERIDEFTFRNRPPSAEEVIDQLRLDAGASSQWIVTDRPFYALQAEILVPPPVAVLSRKRLESGQITEAMLLGVIQRYEPEIVLLERFLELYSESFWHELGQTYKLVLDSGDARYYMRE